MSRINRNLLALNTANTLKRHYSRLETSVKRLSSGLRINCAADDAAGLAIRELMRADVATLNQGIRNANDAISMLQVADGALAIIDEKLIRMKELAEQAATGTYNSTQRLMIHSEFVAMGEEIDRIARATDFNGIKLLDGSLSGQHNGRELNAAGAMKIHFAAGNDSAEDYYYVEIGGCTTKDLGLRATMPATGRENARNSFGRAQGPDSGLGAEVDGWWNDATVDHDKNTIVLEIPSRLAGARSGSPAAVPGLDGFDYYALPVGLKNVTITSNAFPGSTPVHKAHVCIFTKNGMQLTGPPISHVKDEYVQWYPVVDDKGSTRDKPTQPWWNHYTETEICPALIAKGLLNADVTQLDRNHTIYNTGETVSSGNITLTMAAGQTECGTWGNKGTSPDEVILVNEITSDFVFLIGGHSNPTDKCNGYTLRIEAQMTDEFYDAVQAPRPARPDPPGPDVPNPDVPTPDPPQGDIFSIKTQDEAQQALGRIDDAIVKKDKMRAHLGALQNRLENTATTLATQAENLMASESRLSDVDVAMEMSLFVRNQILTQSAVAMLGQANSHPHMLLDLIKG